jgi:hypothetical protein
MDEPWIKSGFGQAEFYGQTTLHSVGVAALCVSAILVFILPRRYAAVPLLAMAALIPSAQRIVVLDLDFTYLRVLLLCGVLRVFLRDEARSFAWRPIDKVFLAWCLVSFTMPLFRVGTYGLETRCGYLYDAVGTYFLFRLLVRDWADVQRLASAAALLSIPLAIAFLVENSTQRNIFSVFGGVPEITRVREGRFRCQGPYSHAILAGCFWAVLLPLIAARWWHSARGRVEATLGLVSCLVIIVCCASSTPVGGAAAALVGGLAFFLRRHMRAARWGVLLGVVGLHLVMKAPVWHLIGRVSAVGGSTGHHRYELIDRAIHRFPEWALLGTNSTAHWGLGLFDVTNQFVMQAVVGGLLNLVLFVALLALCFQAAGRLWQKSSNDPAKVALAWALGVSVFVHISNFIGVTYFGQTTILLYMIPALLGSLAYSATARPALAANRRSQPTLAPLGSRVACGNQIGNRA